MRVLKSFKNGMVEGYVQWTASISCNSGLTPLKAGNPAPKGPDGVVCMLMTSSLSISIHMALQISTPGTPALGLQKVERVLNRDPSNSSGILRGMSDTKVGMAWKCVCPDIATQTATECKMTIAKSQRKD